MGCDGWFSNLTLPRCSCLCPAPDDRMSKADRHLQGIGGTYPTWQHFASVYFFWPSICQMLVTFLLIVLNPIYRKLYARKKIFYRFVRLFIGTNRKPQVEKPAFMTTCYILQLVLSIMSVRIFAERTYRRNVSDQSMFSEACMSVFFSFHYCILRLHHEFRPSSAWAFDSFIDNLTIVPVFFSPKWLSKPEIPDTANWLSLNFLRSYRALLAFQRLDKTADLLDSELARAVLHSCLRFTALVVCMGGTVMVLEILGPIPGAKDPTLATGMGDLSFIQMIYWIFTTISTVGYGDFSPTTIPSRFAICIFIVLGVIFFSSESSSLLELRTIQGRGSYTSERSDGHIVVAGAGAGKMSSMMETFLTESLDPVSGLAVPHVVLMSEQKFDPQLEDFVKQLPTNMGRKVVMLIGSAMLDADLDRAKVQHAEMVFVIPDMAARDSSVEDGHNTMRTLHIKTCFPNARLRLMLLEPNGKAQAVSLGLMPERCFSAFELKSSLLAQSSRCRGLLPLLAGLLQETTQTEIKGFRKAQSPGPWFREYAWGLKWTVYGFMIHPSFEKTAFKEFAANVYRQTDGSVLVIAAQRDGQLELNFDGELSSNQVCVAIAESMESIHRFANTSSDWRVHFAAERRRAFLEGTKRKTSQRVLELHKIKFDGQGDCKTGVLSTSNTPPFTDATTPSFVTTYASSSELEVMLESPRLVVLLACCGDDFGSDSNSDQHSVWQQVNTCITTFRTPGLPSMNPLVVMSDVHPPEHMVRVWHEYNVAFLTGSLEHTEHLVLAGITKAQTIIVLNSARPDTSQGTSAVLHDHEALVLVSLIEELCHARLQKGMQSNIYELNSTDTLILMEMACRIDWSLENDEGDRSFMHLPKRHHIRELGTSALKVGRVLKRILRTSFCNVSNSDSTAEFEAAASKRLIMQSRFAAGQIFTPDFYGCLLGHVFHFPATFELIETMMMPARYNQTNWVWQVRVPPAWVGKEFFQLALSWMLGEDDLLQGMGTALPLAIYRFYDSCHDESASVLDSRGFNITLPQGTEVLLSSDLVTVIATPGFAKTMAAQQLLHSAEDFVPTAVF